jgi:hypothetical protein
MRLPTQFAWAIGFCSFILPLAVACAQDVPPPKPKPADTTSNTGTTKHQVASASILVRADVDCRIQVDDHALGLLKAGTVKSLRATLGEHLIRAVAEADNTEVWEETVTIQKAEQFVVTTQLTAIINAKVTQVNREHELRAAEEVPQDLASPCLGVAPEWSLALIGNASAPKFPGRRPGPEAFSMRRQVGSRWCLRRTRSPMGFEWRFS